LLTAGRFPEYKLLHFYRQVTEEQGFIPGMETHWFFGPIWKNRRFVYQAAIASLVTNVFALGTSVFSLIVYNKIIPAQALTSLAVLVSGMAILLITHDLNMVRRFADRVLVMENGYLVEVVGMLVTAGIMLAIITFIAMRYGEAVEVTSYGRGDRPDHRVERQMGEFNVFWLIKSAVFSRPSGFAIVSLLLLLLESARKSGL
jgi:hypothetical protein